MTRLISREEIGLRDRISNPGPFAAGAGRSVVLHYTGISAREDPLTFEQQALYLRQLQTYYQSGRHPNGNPIGTFPDGRPRYSPYSDTGYNLCVFADGTKCAVRGLDVRSGANGSAASNNVEPSILLAGLDVGEPVTPEMIEGVRWLIRYIETWFGRKVEQVKGHKDVYVDGRGRPLTSCPGDDAYELIQAGVFLASTPPPPILPPPPPPVIPPPSGEQETDMLTYFRNAESRSVPTQPNPNTPDGLWFPGQVIYVFNANTGQTRRVRELEVTFVAAKANMTPDEWVKAMPLYSNGQIDNMIAANAITV